MKSFYIFFLLGVLSLQFYLYKSGTLQPSHISFLVSLFIITLLRGFSKSLVINKHFIRLIYFIFITLFINTTYAIIHFNFNYIISSSYYIFGIIVTYLILFFLTKSTYQNILVSLLFITLILLLVLWYFGYGNYDNRPRYNGFFNDPNQMAHWALCTLVMIVLLNDKNKIINYISLIMTMIIILLSLSRSGLLGIFVVSFTIFLPNKKNIIIILSIIFLFYIFLYFYNFSDSIIFENFDSLITRFIESDFGDQADTRGYNRIYQYPEYLFFGSGQAEDYRFKSDFEIHSTWMGILFYYGIFTLTYFIYFLYKLFSNLNIFQIGIIMGPLIYGFSTFGLRTPIFWMLIGVIIYKSTENNYTTINKLSGFNVI